MQPHQERVVQEKQELDERLFKLRLFMEKAAFKELDIREKSLLTLQAQVMHNYSDILAERIALWSK